MPELPWDGPAFDPVADLRTYVNMMRERYQEPVACTCSACRSGLTGYDNLGYSIYGPEQEPAERMSNDAARWTPSLLEEEEILKQARAVGVDPAPASIQSQRPSLNIYDELIDFGAYYEQDIRDTFGGATSEDDLL